MSESEQGSPITISDEASRFQKLVRALFGVQKQDVPKHEPKKRRSPALSNDKKR